MFFWITGLFPLDLPEVNPPRLPLENGKEMMFRLVIRLMCFLNDGRATKNTPKAGSGQDREKKAKRKRKITRS